MAMNDPLGDLLTRIRNGQKARMSAVTSPASRLRANVLDVLKREGYIRNYSVDGTKPGGEITVDSPAYRTALDIYKKLYDEGTSPKDSTTYEFAEANAAFGAGQVATMVQWNAAFGDLDNKDKTPAVAGKIGTVAPPTV